MESGNRCYSCCYGDMCIIRKTNVELNNENDFMDTVAMIAIVCKRFRSSFDSSKG